MEAAEVPAPGLLRQVTVPVALAVAVVVAAAWYVTWATTDLVMMLTQPSMTGSEPLLLATFYALLVVMMVAMMLPSALPMIVAYRGLTRLEGGRPVRPADNVGTALFVLPYFLVWGAFSVVALFGLVALGPLGMFEGGRALVPAIVLAAAGLYQFTRPKEVCLSHCESPLGFVVHHWRSGRAGAVRMGARHALYCVGCCWLFMLVLFVVGAMSLPWMGAISIAIFAEKVGKKPLLVARGIGVLFLVVGGLFALRALAAG
jgi:predicted metal-binding membrane protein